MFACLSTGSCPQMASNEDVKRVFSVQVSVDGQSSPSRLVCLLPSTPKCTVLVVTMDQLGRRARPEALTTYPQILVPPGRSTTDFTSPVDPHAHDNHIHPQLRPLHTLLTIALMLLARL
jgi:hypothetical protein